MWYAGLLYVNLAHILGKACIVFLHFSDCSTLKCKKKVGCETSKEYNFVELFAGAANISKALRFAGHFGVSMDLDHHPAHDFLDDSGLALAMIAILKMLPGGLLVAAPVCSSFSSMSRASSKRTVFTPAGDVDRIFVRQGNVMVRRLVLVLWLAHSLGHAFVVEQPRGSIMSLLDRFEAFCNSCCRVVSTSFWMKIYGSDTAKRTVVYAIFAAVKRLDMGAVCKDRGFWQRFTWQVFPSDSALAQC